MSRKLLGYRVRAERNGSFVYATGGEAYLWHETPGRPETREECRKSKRIALHMNRENPATNVKIVAVYLRTKGEPARELSDFNRAVVEEIERRGIDAIVEPEDFGGMPTTLRFRAPNGHWIWIPILACSVVDGPKETRASRTVDRMLETIRSLANVTLENGDRFLKLETEPRSKVASDEMIEESACASRRTKTVVNDYHPPRKSNIKSYSSLAVSSSSTIESIVAFRRIGSGGICSNPFVLILVPLLGPSESHCGNS